MGLTTTVQVLVWLTHSTKKLSESVQQLTEKDIGGTDV